jgi:hypothetical protein
MANTWQNLSSDGSVRWLKYSFGPGRANTLAARLDDGTWLVVSPALNTGQEALEVLAKEGGVSALVAPNGFHHLGQAEWRAKFPKAISYAPEGALPRLTKKSFGITYKPLSSLQPLLGTRVSVLVPDGMKLPDLLVQASASGKSVWYTGDLLSNTSTDDLSLMFRLIMTPLGAGPGYRFNRLPALVYVKDRKAWTRSVLEAMEKNPPSAILPGHGSPITEGVMEKTRSILSGT